MRTAAIVPAPIPAPALVLAAIPALVTVGFVGILLYLASDLQRAARAPGLGDPFQLWSDHSGVVREMKLVGLRHEPEGSQAQFITRDGCFISRPIADLQQADQERAWDAAFALDPVLSFKGASMRKSDPQDIYDHYYYLKYNFEVSGLPIDRVVENSITINEVPIEGLHGMFIRPSKWTLYLNLHGDCPGPVRSEENDCVEFSASGNFSPQSLKGALAEGRLTAICTGDLAEEKISMKVPAHAGLVTKASVGPIQLALTTSGQAPWQRKLALEVSGGSTGQLSYAGFDQEGSRADVRMTYIEGRQSEITISTGYYRRVKVVELPFSGTPE